MSLSISKVGMPPPRNHDENRLAVCLLCFQKSKEMTKITTNLQETINLHFLDGYDSNDARLPGALCGNCRHIVQEYKNGRFDKQITVYDYSEIGIMPRPITRSGLQCFCKICEIGRSNFLNKRVTKKSPGRPSTGKTSNTQSPPKPIRICSFCLTKLSRGKPHECCKLTRHNNLLQIPNEREKDQIASSILREKKCNKVIESNSPLKLTTITGKPLTVDVSPSSSTSKQRYLSVDNISVIQLDLNLSYNQTLKLAAHIRSSTKSRTSVEVGLKQKLFEKHHQLDYMFNVSEDVEYLTLNQNKVVERKIKPTVFCTDVNALFEYVIGKRGQIENDNLCCKICLDGGGGFLKICLSIFNTTDDFPKQQRRKYTDEIAAPAFRDTGVKKLFILAIAPEVQENYSNILRMWVLAQIASGMIEWKHNYSIATDLKLANIILGLMSHSSQHPCTWCDIVKDELHKQGNSRTLKSLTDAFWDWYTSDGERTSAAKQYGNVVHIPLLQGDLDDLIINLLPPPELHLLIGPFNTIFKSMESNFPEIAAAWTKHCCVEKEAFHGGHFNGNSSKRLLNKLDFLRSISPIGCLKYIQCFDSFKTVIHSCYGYSLDENFKDHINEFKVAYMDISIPVTPKVHAIWYHIPEFCSAVNEGLARWSEQASETVHADFKQTWKKYSVSICHPAYSSRLLSAVQEYNASHL